MCNEIKPILRSNMKIKMFYILIVSICSTAALFATDYPAFRIFKDHRDARPSVLRYVSHMVDGMEIG